MTVSGKHFGRKVPLGPALPPRRALDAPAPCGYQLSSMGAAGAVGGLAAGEQLERPPSERPPGGRTRLLAERHPLLGRLRLHPGVAVVLGACAALFHAAMHTGLSGDVYFHWAAGNWMLDHHGVIRRDVFSYTVQGRPWVADEWGFELALAWLVRTIGPVAFWLASAGSCALALLLSVARWRRQGAQWLWTAALACLAAAGLLYGLGPRPQDPSYALFAAELLLLSLARSDARWLAALPLLLLVWANVHGSFLLGLGVLVLELVWSLLPELHGRLRVEPRLAPRPVAAALGASVLASFVNPHGPGLLAYAAKVSASTELTSLIQEWQSPNFHDLYVLALVVGPLLWLVAVLGLSSRRLDLGEVVLALLLLVLTLHAVRFLPYLVLAWCSVMSRWVPGRETIRPSWLTLPVAIALVAGLLAGPHVPAGAPQRGSGSLDMPVDAAAYLRHQQGRVFATYWWGDYLDHVGIPVFVDGRTDLYFGTKVLSTYVAVSELTTDPDAVFGRWDVRWVLWNRDTALSRYLSRDPGWRLVLSSGDALVYEHLGRW